MHCALRNGPNQAQAKHTPAMVLKATQPDVELQVAAATPGPEAPFWTQRARRKCTHQSERNIKQRGPTRRLHGKVAGCGRERREACQVKKMGRGRGG